MSIRMLAAIGILLSLLAGCEDDHNADKPESSSATLTFGETGLPMTGVPYMAARPESRAARSGRTDTLGTFRFMPGDTVTFYLDDARTMPLASILLIAADLGTANLFETGLADSDPDFARNLALLLASLDEDTDAEGVELPTRVSELATEHATGLASALRSSSTEQLAADPAVLALLAAMDDPATPEDEGRGADALTGIGASLNVYGLGTLLPFADKNGVICATGVIKPGCTFSRGGARLTVADDPHYNRYGYGSDDIGYVQFDVGGKVGSVYDNLGVFQFSALPSDFAGYVGISSIGVGAGPGESENISGGTYWLGETGVLYSANSFASNYGKAIN